MTIRNLTPHTVTILREGMDPLVIPSEGIASAKAERVTLGEVDGIEISRTEFGAPIGLPPYDSEVDLLVSVITAQAVAKSNPDRDDIFVVGSCARGHAGCELCRLEGRIIAAHGIARI